jgi:uncharacterized protein (TIGR02284 family)
MILELRGTAIIDTDTMAMIHRAWMDFKAMINDGDRISILQSCEYGEEVTVTVYKNVFIKEAGALSDSILSKLKAQHLLLHADHEKVKECIALLDT